MEDAKRKRRAHPATFLMEVAGDEGRGGFWKEDAAKQNHQGWDSCHSQRDPPAVLINLDCAIVDELGNDDANRSAPLEEQIQRASILRRGHL